MNFLCAILLSIVTTLSDGMYHTTYETTVDASKQECYQALDTMIYYLQTNPQKLSNQYFAGLGKQDDKNKNAFYLGWKETSYDPVTRYSKIMLDVLVEEKPYLKDVAVECLITDTLTSEGRDVRLDVYYSGTLFKEAYGTIHIIPTGENTARMLLDAHVRFGWFFRIFITRRVYSDTVDWRFERFVNNIKLTAQGFIPSDAWWAEQDSLLKEQEKSKKAAKKAAK